MAPKYLIAIIILSVGFLVGLFIFIRGGKGSLGGASLSQAFLGAGQWTEIKPRTEGRAASSTAAAKDSNTNALSENPSVTSPSKNPAKTKAASKPAVSWCEIAQIQSPAREVVVNELAWMGSLESYSNEWIELKNISSAAIDLSGWQLQNKNKKIKIAIGDNSFLPAGGIYLLERTADDSAPGVSANMIYSGSLGNANEALYLFSPDCRLQDLVVATGKWPAGDNTTKKTMARFEDLVWKNSSLPGGTPGTENK